MMKIILFFFFILNFSLFQCQQPMLSPINSNNKKIVTIGFYFLPEVNIPFKKDIKRYTDTVLNYLNGQISDHLNIPLHFQTGEIEKFRKNNPSCNSQTETKTCLEKRPDLFKKNDFNFLIRNTSDNWTTIPNSIYTSSNVASITNLRARTILHELLHALGANSDTGPFLMNEIDNNLYTLSTCTKKSINKWFSTFGSNIKETILGKKNFSEPVLSPQEQCTVWYGKKTKLISFNCQNLKCSSTKIQPTVFISKPFDGTKCNNFGGVCHFWQCV